MAEQGELSQVDVRLPASMLERLYARLATIMRVRTEWQAEGRKCF